MIQLGLIGHEICRSSAPRLHQLSGAFMGLSVSYELFDVRGADAFMACLYRLRDAGYTGVNVTHPFKTVARQQVSAFGDGVAMIGAVNTILFSQDGTLTGHNTDWSGFMAAYQARFGQVKPGRVAIIGAGGVGRPIAAGLCQLGASELRIYDRDLPVAERVAADLGDAPCSVIACHDLGQATQGADGLVNATPVGMHHHPGCPLPAEVFGQPTWAFDAIYTPVDTLFLSHAAAAGAEILSGYELFLHQGIDAFELFTGQKIAIKEIRRLLTAA